MLNLPDSMNRIVSKVAPLDTLRLTAGRLRAEGLTIVLCTGSFDLLHVGHVRFLRGARAMGDALIVAIHGDAAVRREKGEGRPVLSRDHRAVMLAALEMVDYVTVFDDNSADLVLKTLQPHIYAIGVDSAYSAQRLFDVMRAWGGRVAGVGSPQDHSTSAILRKIRGKGE
jgi:D-glycero-beta-D-manno-heptose 1-phosphate adenylyltransferase